MISSVNSSTTIQSQQSVKAADQTQAVAAPEKPKQADASQPSTQVTLSSRAKELQAADAAASDAEQAKPAATNSEPAQANTLQAQKQLDAYKQVAQTNEPKAANQII